MDRASRRPDPAWPRVRGITLDLWGTILQQQDPIEKIERRRAILLGALHDAGHPMPLEQMRNGFRAARAVIDAELASTGLDIGPAGRWAQLMLALGIPPEDLPFDRVHHAYDDLTLEFLPPLMAGVDRILPRLERCYAVALICNTGFTGGPVLRKVLDRHCISECFETLTFSDEFGHQKPHRAIFEHTLQQLGVDAAAAIHVGDTESQDIAGALGAGMFAARYAPTDDGQVAVDTRAHLHIESWAQLADLAGA